MNNKIPVEVSARHCHLSKHDLEKLFGIGHELVNIKQLSQPADFACEEKVTIKFGSKTVENVRVVGLLREKTQIEISLTDAIGSGIMPKVRLSGDLNGSDSIILVGPQGEVELAEGLIIAKRHIHCSETEAKDLGLKIGDMVSVEIKGDRPVIFENVQVRIRDDYKLFMHLDTDEGNAAGINKIGEGLILK